MTVQRLEHIGIVVDDLTAATAFFAALGLEVEGEASVEGGSVDRIRRVPGQGRPRDPLVVLEPG